MSLVRLLSAGKSLIGFNESGRYRVTRQRLLPQFGSVSNPFRSSAEGGIPTPTAPAPPAAAVAPTGTAETKSQPRRGLGAWVGHLLARLERPQIRTAPAIAGSRPAVQGELSLDTVRVLRNDLSEADLEVVPARRPTLRTKPVRVPKAEAEDEAESVWQRGGARLFGMARR
jgi:hypothetical protein